MSTTVERNPTFDPSGLRRRAGPPPPRALWAERILYASRRPISERMAGCSEAQRFTVTVGPARGGVSWARGTGSAVHGWEARRPFVDLGMPVSEGTAS